jgi:hypothetical protein
MGTLWREDGGLRQHNTSLQRKARKDLEPSPGPPTILDNSRADQSSSKLAERTWDSRAM